MPITLPPITHLIFENGNNKILKNFGSPKTLEEYDISEAPYFKVTSEGKEYYFIKFVEAELPEDAHYVLLTSKKPTQRNLEEGSLKIIRWLRHPDFFPITPEAVITSWKDRFKFVKEDTVNRVEGLRPPQLGALHAILAHTQYAEDRAIVVMPTGTGKTEVMLSALVAVACPKLLVTVPSDALRSQISSKFLTLGLLKQFGVVPEDAETPIVGIMGNRIRNRAQLEVFISACNVIITTMPLVAGYNEEFRVLIANRISHLFVDEAHHSEASTWSNFISKVNSVKVFLFTATPFRGDDRKLQGKFVFNFPLRAAQEQRYYKEINFIPIREYEITKADEKIAAAAVEQLRRDRRVGYPHMIMARCGNKSRARDIVAIYETYTDFRSVVVFTGAPSLNDKIQRIKRKEYDIVVCVNMLGEGFDLPELKIAAIHDERQGIPSTLQFVGRFTRTSFDTLGQASFIANIAYPPIRIELERLYAHDADWNLLLPSMSREETERQINFKAFMDGFTGLESSIIPFQKIEPAMSAMIYRIDEDEWNPGNWKNGISRIDEYDHQFSRINSLERTLVIILGKINKVEWGNFDMVANMQWDMIVVYWDSRPDVNRVCVNFSMDNFNPQKLVTAIFGASTLINGMDVFRIFHEVKRLSVYNFGGRPGTGGDISFRSFFGRGVQDGLSLLEQGTLIKNNIFGAGYKEGSKVSLGCSVSGKVWSYQRGNLQELNEWCKMIGDTITDETIDTDTVLRNTLAPKVITQRPPVTPIGIDWHPFIYSRPEHGFTILINGNSYDLSSAELNPVNVNIASDLCFSLDTDDTSTVFKLILGERLTSDRNEPYFTISKISGPDAIITYGAQVGESLTDFFTKYGPIFWFADGSQLMHNLYVEMREHPGRIPLDNIVEDSWVGVNLSKESQGIAPYNQDSIQYYFISKIIDDFEIVYDDDASGEIADVIGINVFPLYIDVHMYHLKFAIGGAVTNQIDNLYQVCGQAQKSLNWKYRKGRAFFDHLLRRINKREAGNTCSRLVKGDIANLEELLTAAKWEKELRFHIYVAQPGFRKANVSDDILLLLGTTYHYLATVGNVELKVYSS